MSKGRVSHMRLRGIAVLAATALLVGCGGGGTQAGSDATTLEGRLVAPECGGGWDIESSQVVLRNQSEDIIATGNTSTNLLAPLGGEPCVVDFTLTDVPEAEFYTVKVGTHSGPAWSHEDLVEQDFKAELNLGDASIPTTGADDLCGTLDGLHQLLLDTDTMNEKHRSWDAQLAGLRKKVDAYAASQLLAGERSSGTEAADFADLLPPLDYDAWYSVKELNRSVKPVNDQASALTSRLDCLPLWSGVSYSP